MSWRPVTSPPPLYRDEHVDWMSEPVLVYTASGMLVATLEQRDGDPAEWYSDCFEHWNITGYVLFWTYLPDPPFIGDEHD